MNETEYTAIHRPNSAGATVAQDRILTSSRADEDGDDSALKRSSATGRDRNAPRYEYMMPVVVNCAKYWSASAVRASSGGGRRRRRGVKSSFDRSQEVRTTSASSRPT